MRKSSDAGTDINIIGDYMYIIKVKPGSRTLTL